MLLRVYHTERLTQHSCEVVQQFALRAHIHKKQHLLAADDLPLDIPQAAEIVCGARKL
jgi:hypothetical protein